MNSLMPWHSFYLFLPDHALLERFLLEQVLPVIEREEGLPANWFFIRYWENGPHLRLRIRNCPEALVTDLKNEWRKALRDFGGPAKPRVATLVEESYEPELSRYGGTAAMSYNEEVFVRSSNLAVATIRARTNNLERHITHALNFMLVTAAAINRGPRHMHAFFSRYATFWQRFLGLAEGDDLESRPETLDSERILAMLQNHQRSGPYHYWWAQIGWLVAELESLARGGNLLSPADHQQVTREDELESTIDAIVGSQMHMLNNRLGISPQQEYRLASVIAKGFEHAR